MKRKRRFGFFVEIEREDVDAVLRARHMELTPANRQLVLANARRIATDAANNFIVDLEEGTGTLLSIDGEEE